MNHSAQEPSAGMGAGAIDVITTYLEMLHPPAGPLRTSPTHDVMVVENSRPDIVFYRRLYNSVGEQWMWMDRRRMSDDDLRRIIEDPDVKILVLYVEGAVAGYAELDFRTRPDVELVYFGLVPAFIGKGFGSYFLDYAVHFAWSHTPKRLWLHTCTLDHPRALGVYKREGFVIYKSEAAIIPDPRSGQK